MAQKKLILGRDSNCDIAISSPYLSSKHAEITLLDVSSLTFSVTDLGSTNGTFINDEKIDKATFTFGDQLSLGAYKVEANDFIPHFITLSEKNRHSVLAASNLRNLLFASLAIGSIALTTLLAIFMPQILLVSLASMVLLGFIIYVAFELHAQQQRRKSEALFFEFKNNKFATLAEQYDREIKQRSALDQATWQGFRKFKVAKKVQENGDITSFYLQPHDAQPIPSFKPGQYLTFKLQIPGQASPVMRCYSLSCGPGHDYYRVSIKRATAPKPDVLPGLGSNYFHDHIHPGTIIDVKNPSGGFYLDVTKANATVLLAGGIGITPMLSMLETLVSNNITDPIWLFYGVRDKSELTQMAYINKIASEHSNVNICVCFSKPGNNDVFGVDYHHLGRVNVQLLQDKLGSNNYQFYLCGPGPFMNSLTEGLESWGVPEEDINSEAFGPSSVKKKAPTEAEKSVEIFFKKSNKKINANNQLSLLEIAEAEGITMEFGCRAGSCGACETALLEGAVKYDDSVDYDISAGCCLACMARASDNIVIDA